MHALNDIGQGRAMTTVLYMYVFLRKRRAKVKNKVVDFVSALLVDVALSYEKLGAVLDEDVNTGPWCWVKVDQSKPKESLPFMITTGKGWEILCYISTVTLYALVKLQVVSFLLVIFLLKE